MESWDEHQVTFAPAEGLEKNETSVRVLDQKDSSATQTQKQRRRIMAADATTDPEDIDDFQHCLLYTSPSPRD